MADEDKVGKTKRYVNAACEALGISPTTFLSAGLEHERLEMNRTNVELATVANTERAKASNRVAVALLVRGFIEAELARIPK